MGWAEYRPAGESVIIAHTEIDERMLDRIRASGRTVIPTCAFTAAYIHRHPEYVELVDSTLRDRFISAS